MRSTGHARSSVQQVVVRPNYADFMNTKTDNAENPSLHSLDGRRLEALLALCANCKWADSGPLEELRPEDEKYMTKESILAALDERAKPPIA
jgi:hypothetical protein